MSYSFKLLLRQRNGEKLTSEEIALTDWYYSFNRDYKCSGIRFYFLDTVFKFGKFKDSTVREIIDVQPSYLDWCSTHLNSFYITNETLEEIKSIIPNFSISKEGTSKLIDKYNTLKNAVDKVYKKQTEEMSREASPSLRFDTLKSWLISAYGDNGETTIKIEEFKKMFPVIFVKLYDFEKWLIHRYGLNPKIELLIRESYCNYLEEENGEITYLNM